VKIIRIVINNEAYIDIQAAEDLNWMQYCNVVRNALLLALAAVVAVWAG